MKIAKRQSETVFNIVTLLAGRAWDVVEDLTVYDVSSPDCPDAAEPFPDSFGAMAWLSAPGHCCQP